MFNVGGGEMFAVLLLALIVLGPERLPKAMGEVGKVIGQLRRLSSGFQDELKKAMDTQATDDEPFRPGEEALPALAPGVEEEVRVISGSTTDASAEAAPATGATLGEEAADEPATVDEPVADPVDEDGVEDLPRPDDEPDEPVVGQGEASVTPLRPRRDDTRATG